MESYADVAAEEKSLKSLLKPISQIDLEFGFAQATHHPSAEIKRLCIFLQFMLNFISIWKVGWQASAQFFFHFDLRQCMPHYVCVCMWLQVDLF